MRWHLVYAARFVAKWEGFRSHAYLDTIAQPPVETIGYGHTGNVGPTWVWSKLKALHVLTRDLKVASQAVSRHVHVPLTFRQRIALISLVFNCGESAIAGSRIQHFLNRREYEKAADEFLAWCHAGGVVVQGLLNRRRAERWMFLHSHRPLRKNPIQARKQTIKGPSVELDARQVPVP